MPRARRSTLRPLAGRAIPVVPLLLLAGCSDPTDADAGTSARERWARAQPANYAYTLSRGCFCLDEVVRPVVVEVRGGVVQSRTYAASGAAVDARWASSFPTIDGLFAELDDAEKHADRMQVTYDRQYGYPQHAYIDFAARTADDEMEFTITDFHTVP